MPGSDEEKAAQRELMQRHEVKAWLDGAFKTPPADAHCRDVDARCFASAMVPYCECNCSRCAPSKTENAAR